MEDEDRLVVLSMMSMWIRLLMRGEMRLMVLAFGERGREKIRKKMNSVFCFLFEFFFSFFRRIEIGHEREI